MTEPSKEKATVLKSSTDDPALEMYTVEKVAVIVPELVEKLSTGCVSFFWVDEGEGVAMKLMVVDTPDKETIEVSVIDREAEKACVEGLVAVMKLGSAVSEVGIAPLVEDDVEEYATDVGCCNVGATLTLPSEIKAAKLPLDGDKGKELVESTLATDDI